MTQPQTVDDLKDTAHPTIADFLEIRDGETGEVLVAKEGGQSQPARRGGLETGSPA